MRICLTHYLLKLFISKLYFSLLSYTYSSLRRFHGLGDHYADFGAQLWSQREARACTRSHSAEVNRLREPWRATWGSSLKVVLREWAVRGIISSNTDWTLWESSFPLSSPCRVLASYQLLIMHPAPLLPPSLPLLSDTVSGNMELLLFGSLPCSHLC